MENHISKLNCKLWASGCYVRGRGEVKRVRYGISPAFFTRSKSCLRAAPQCKCFPKKVVWCWPDPTSGSPAMLCAPPQRFPCPIKESLLKLTLFKQLSGLAVADPRSTEPHCMYAPSLILRLGLFEKEAVFGGVCFGVYAVGAMAHKCDTLFLLSRSFAASMLLLQPQNMEESAAFYCYSKKVTKTLDVLVWKVFKCNNLFQGLFFFEFRPFLVGNGILDFANWFLNPSSCFGKVLALEKKGFF